MAVDLITKEETIPKYYKTGIILLADGSIPSDYPAEKALTYLNLRNEKLYRGKTDFGKLNELEEEIKNWSRNEQNDPYYFRILELVNQLRFTINYVIDLAFKEFCKPDLKTALLNMISMKVQNILIIPLEFLHDPIDHVRKAIEETRADKYANIQLLWPYEISLQVDFITEHLLRFIRKHHMFSY